MKLREIMNNEWNQYKRTNVAEMRPVTEDEIMFGVVSSISVSEADEKAGSPNKGDMIARNPNNHDDKWLVAAKYFQENFEEVN